ncbi:MAG TPA: hypothetical protein VFX25_27955 [Streptosporangiaceae bacterium]|nr:hypothetical protein [Streptosporangiaceae bacterium]
MLEAIDIPHGATTGDQEARDRLLVERAGHAVVMLRDLLRRQMDPDDALWGIGYLRDRLAEHPATGYKTWAERMAELDAAKRIEGPR